MPSTSAGASDSMLYPGAGPFDKRLGYSSLGDFLPRLLKRDYVIAEQTRFSPALLSYSKKGFFVPYSEKIQAGLSITDCSISARGRGMSRHWPTDWPIWAPC